MQEDSRRARMLEGLDEALADLRCSLALIAERTGLLSADDTELAWARTAAGGPLGFRQRFSDPLGLSARPAGNTRGARRARARGRSRAANLFAALAPSAGGLERKRGRQAAARNSGRTVLPTASTPSCCGSRRPLSTSCASPTAAMRAAMGLPAGPPMGLAVGTAPVLDNDLSLAGRAWRPNHVLCWRTTTETPARTAMSTPRPSRRRFSPEWRRKPLRIAPAANTGQL